MDQGHLEEYGVVGNEKPLLRGTKVNRTYMVHIKNPAYYPLFTTNIWSYFIIFRSPVITRGGWRAVWGVYCSNDAGVVSKNRRRRSFSHCTALLLCKIIQPVGLTLIPSNASPKKRERSSKRLKVTQLMTHATVEVHSECGAWCILLLKLVWIVRGIEVPHTACKEKLKLKLKLNFRREVLHSTSHVFSFCFFCISSKYQYQSCISHHLRPSSKHQASR